MKVLAFGEILWDLIEGENHLGGAAFNFAAHTVKCGGESSIISAVGADALGRLALEQAKALGVEVTFIESLPDFPTGTVDVFLKNGQPDYTIHERVAFDFIPRPELNKIQVGAYDVFYFGTLAQRNSISRNTLQWIFQNLKFKHVFFDINLRKNYFTKEIVQYSLLSCTIFKINDSETQVISALLYGTILEPEEFSKRIAADFKIAVVIITAGETGCYIARDNRFVHMPGNVVEVVDTVGAGDSFSAAFMHAYFNHRNEEKASAIANRIGAYVASKRGAIPPYPEEISRLLNEVN